MREAAVREFHISPNQYQVFRFSIPRPGRLYIDMIATSAVDVLLLDSENRFAYEHGSDSITSYKWGRRVSIDDSVEVDADTWHIVVEGRDEPSKGRIKVFQM